MNSQAGPTHRVLIATRRAQRASLLEELSLPPQLMAPVSAHRRLRGPYTAAGTIMRDLVPKALKSRPDLVADHHIEILSVAPELRDLLPVTTETLTSLAIPSERTRFYSRMRTLRLSHGLVEFLRDYLFSYTTEPMSLVLEDLHSADPTDQEFVAVLLRRISPAQLTVVVGSTQDFIEITAYDVEYGATSASPVGGLPKALRRFCKRSEGAAVADSSVITAACADLDLARQFVAGDGTGDDPVSIAAYNRVAKADLAILHDQRAAELVSRNERSLSLGAIAYHREHGSDVAGAGIHALADAMDYSLLMGFYESCIELCHRGRALLDPEKDSHLWWTFSAKLPTSLSALGRVEEAERICARTRSESRHPLLHIQFAYATAMLHTRHYAVDRRDDEQALGWINIAIALASTVTDPKQRAFYFVFNCNGLALIESHRGRPEKALELVTNGLKQLDLELAPGEHQLHRSVLRYNRAQVLVGLGRFDEALADYETVISIDPNYPEYHFDLGNLLRRLGRDQDALEQYEKAAELSPPFPELFYNRADLHAEAGDIDAALRDFSYVLELDPDYVDAYLNRAGLLADLGDNTAAGRDVDAGLALAPQNPHLLSLRARLAMEAADLETARAAVEQAVLLQPELAEAWALLGGIEFDSGNLPAALNAMSNAVQLQPHSVMLFNRAMVHQAMQQWDLAITDLDEVLTAQPDESDVWLSRARCRAATGDLLGARTDAETGLLLDPTRTDDVAEILSSAAR